MSARGALAPLFGLVLIAWLGLGLSLAPLGGRASRGGAELGAAWVRDGRGEQPCEPLGSGFDCGPKPWHQVEPREVMVRGKRERCVWVHPQEGRVVLLTLPTPTSAKPEPLRIAFALDDRAVGDGAPVEVELWRGAARLEHKHAERAGWQALDVPGEPGELLTLAVRSAQEGRRHFCFKLEGAARLP